MYQTQYFTWINCLKPHRRAIKQVGYLQMRKVLNSQVTYPGHRAIKRSNQDNSICRICHMGRDRYLKWEGDLGSLTSWHIFSPIFERPLNKCAVSKN